MESNESTAVVVQEDNVPQLSEKGLAQAGTQIKLMNQFVKEQMKVDQDYGKIGPSKPTLFKSGAEKLENIFKLSHRFEQMEKTENWMKGLEFFFYRYKCIVYGKHGDIAECIGSANSKEPSRKNQNIYTLPNVIDKMAQKRAFVGAILSACRVSSQFTQDLEDMKGETVAKPLTNVVLECEKCGKSITQKVANWSAEKLGKVLCFDCQNPTEEKPVL